MAIILNTLTICLSGWQVAAEEICVWEDGDPVVRDQIGAISQGETLPGSSTKG